MELYKENQLKIYNSLSKTKEDFKPITEGYVGMYVCGPTVYSNAHLGNVRTFMFLPTEYIMERIYRYDNHFITNAWKKNIFPVGPAGLINIISLANLQINNFKRIGENHLRFCFNDVYNYFYIDIKYK